MTSHGKPCVPTFWLENVPPERVIVINPNAAFGCAVVDLPPAASSSREAAVRFLVERLVQSGRLELMHADRVVRQVLHRESIASTGVGGGIAVPHSKSDAVSDVLGIVGWSTVALTWPGAVDAQPVRMVCLLITPESAPRESLRALQAVALEVSKLKGGRIRTSTKSVSHMNTQ